KLNGSSGSEVTADGGEAAAQAGGLNLQPATFFEIQANGANGLLQPDALVPTLANEARLRGNLERRKHQVFFADAALGQELAHPFGIQFLEGLHRGDAQFMRITPAEHFFGFYDALQRGQSFRRMNAAQSFDGFYAQKFRAPD